MSASLEPIDYQVWDTATGRRRRCRYGDGTAFSEYVSKREWFGLPLVHVVRGRDPETGRGVTARGVLAVGRTAVGVVAVGQASAGIVAIGQASLGVLFGFGQATAGALAIGQVAVGAYFGLGQLATGVVAIGQVAFGDTVLAQFGLGKHVFDVRRADPVAKQFFGL